MSTTVGLDPAINSPGLGVVRDGVLVGAWNVKIPAAFKRLPMGERIQAVAERIVYELRSRPYNKEHEVVGALEDGDAIVYECPQIYGVGVSKVDPNNLIMLAEVGAAVTRELMTSASTNAKIRVLRPLPREWTGGTSKNPDAPFDSSRWRRIKMLITPAEAAIVPEQHDAIDGVGLALHDTPRALALPRRVYPGASPPRSKT